MQWHMHYSNMALLVNTTSLTAFLFEITEHTSLNNNTYYSMQLPWCIAIGLLIGASLSEPHVHTYLKLGDFVLLLGQA